MQRARCNAHHIGIYQIDQYNIGKYEMTGAIISGLFTLAGILIAWLMTLRKNRLEREKLQLEINQLQLRAHNEQQGLRELTVDTPKEILKYFKALIAELNIWEDGLGLGRPIDVKDIYVWVDVANDGESKGIKFKDDDLFTYLLANRRAALIKGGPGSGKSTLIRRWAYMAANNYLTGQSDFVPFFISLNQLCQLNESINLDLTMSEITLRLFYGNRTVHPGLLSIFIDAVNNGKALLFLDGADEIPNAVRDRFANWINKIPVHAPQCLLIITSRPCTYIDKIVNFEHYKMVEFNDAQITSFVDRWFETLSHNVAKRSTVDRVLASPLILKSNPLFLTMTCIIIERGNEAEIPSAGALFERFVRELLQHRATKYELTIETRAKLYILQQLASMLFDGDRLTIQEELLIDEVEKMMAHKNIMKGNLGDSSIIIKEIVESSGILRYNRSGYYGFYHQLFQEFFFARGVKQHIDQRLFDEAKVYNDYAFVEKYNHVVAFLHELMDLDKVES